MNERIVILGLGNPVLTDDAVGLKVVDELEKLLKADPIPGVEVLASTRAGFELIDLLQEFDHAIIIDAIEVENPQPGRIQQIDLSDLTGNARLIAVHEISINVAFELAEKLGIPMPKTVEILAVEVEDVITLSEEMTPKVAAIVEPFAVELYERVKKRAGEFIRTDDDRDDENNNRTGKIRAFYPPNPE